ncbi:MAG: hypothetical protein CR996_00700 [Draconibacterium sp.]|nr:MAG: hypothetical protein CR996_00700 [Draconibacterium sp.]PIF05229.1 MAG: hypothetical protein CSA36_07840 [Draconibacterium sp.]
MPIKIAPLYLFFDKIKESASLIYSTKKTVYIFDRQNATHQALYVIDYYFFVPNNTKHRF